jgi:hypothetical protein
MKPSLHLSESAIGSVLGRARTIVVQWSLTLERQGVLGEGMTFTEEERPRPCSTDCFTTPTSCKSQVETRDSDRKAVACVHTTIKCH